MATTLHTPHAAVTDVLNVLHPAEPAWIAEKAEGPAWFLKAAAAVPAPDDEDNGVLRLPGDDELARHPDTAAVPQSWLDSPAVDESLSRSEVCRAVVKSRHHTLEHLRQIPADEVLSRHEPEIALTILLEHCGRSTGRWEALATTMTFEYDDTKLTVRRAPRLPGRRTRNHEGHPTSAIDAAQARRVQQTSPWCPIRCPRRPHRRPARGVGGGYRRCRTGGRPG